MDQKQKDKLAELLGISKAEQEIYDTASSHQCDCRCDICRKYWNLLGPDPDDGMFGPFTIEEVEWSQERYDEWAKRNKDLEVLEEQMLDAGLLQEKKNNSTHSQKGA